MLKVEIDYGTVKRKTHERKVVTKIEGKPGHWIRKEYHDDILTDTQHSDRTIKPSNWKDKEEIVKIKNPGYHYDYIYPTVKCRNCLLDVSAKNMERSSMTTIMGVFESATTCPNCGYMFIEPDGKVQYEELDYNKAGIKNESRPTTSFGNTLVIDFGRAGSGTIPRTTIQPAAFSGVIPTRAIEGEYVNINPVGVGWNDEIMWTANPVSLNEPVQIPEEEHNQLLEDRQAMVRASRDNLLREAGYEIANLPSPQAIAEGLGIPRPTREGRQPRGREERGGRGPRN